MFAGTLTMQVSSSSRENMSWISGLIGLPFLVKHKPQPLFGLIGAPFVLSDPKTLVRLADCVVGMM